MVCSVNLNLVNFGKYLRVSRLFRVSFAPVCR
jgi:hypothetical protein